MVGVTIAATSCGSSESPASSPAEVVVTTTAVVNTPVATTTTTEVAVATSSLPAPEPDTSGVPVTTALTSITTAPSPTNCRRVTEFGPNDIEWLVVNDGVMGGGSNGAVDVTNSIMQFTGDVVTQGGGFTSVRLRLVGDELAGSDRVDLRVRTDDRTYGLTFEDEAQVGPRFVSYRADLATDPSATDADGWQVVSLSYDELRPSVFGRSVEAEPFAPEQALEIGIIIADGVDGPFGLDVDWVDACS